MTNEKLAGIVEQVKKNKKDNFEKLFNEICKTIYYMSLRILRNQTEAEDATQEIILYIYTHIDELQKAERFNRWMNRIILGTCNGMLRRKLNAKDNSYMEEYQKTKVDNLETMPEKLILTKEQRDALLHIIEQLPTKQKEVVLLYYYQQMSTPEIAEVLDCSLGAVQNRIHKAKKSIEQKIKSSQYFNSEKLRSISIFAVIPLLLRDDAIQQCRPEITAKIWSGVEAKFDEEFRNGYLITSFFRQNLKVILCAFLVCLLGSTGIYAYYRNFYMDRVRLPEQSDYQKPADNNAETNDIFSMAESIKGDKAPENELDYLSVNDSDVSISGPENGRIGVDIHYRSETQKESEDWRLDISYEIAVGRDITFGSDAFLIDQEMKALTYRKSAEGRAQDDSIYEESEYIKLSDETYHKIEETILDVKKTSGSQPGSNIITCDILIVNNGKEPVHNLTVRDNILHLPENSQIFWYVIRGEEDITDGFTVNGPELSWHIDVLQQGESVKIHYKIMSGK